MKKLIILMISLFLMMSFAIAANDMENEKGNKSNVTSVPGLYGSENGGMMDESSLIMERDQDRVNQNITRNGTGPIMMQNGTQFHAGLYNALENVENENARAALNRNMERFLERYQMRLQDYENITVEIDEENENMVVKAKREVKYFGFINGKATEKLEIEKNGNVVEKKPWYRFMYSENTN